MHGSSTKSKLTISNLKKQLEDLRIKSDELLTQKNDLLGELNVSKIESSPDATDSSLITNSEMADGVTNSVKPESSSNTDSSKASQSVPILTAQHIASIIAKSTGIPVGSLLESEKTDLLQMESFLRSYVVGQDHALRVIAKCIRLSRAGLRHHDRPLGVFLLLGPTGVGKTELSKALSLFLFKNPAAMTRIDMSEYMEK